MRSETENHICEALKALIPAYSIGATDPEESQFVRAHLAECPEAAAELAQFMDLADAMLYAAPAVQAPEGLAERLQASLAGAPPVHASPRPAEQAGRPGGFWQQLQALLAGWQIRPAYAVAAVAFVALVAMVAANLYWGSQLGQAQADQAALAQRLAQHSDFLAMVAEEEPWHIELASGPAGEESGARAVMVCSPESNVGLIYAENLPPAEAGTGYQVWLTRPGETVSSGMLELNQQGTGTLVFRAPAPVGEYETIGITAEPADGSSNPTSPPVVEGPIEYDEEHETDH